jgi:hypothetical protein
MNLTLDGDAPPPIRAQLAALDGDAPAVLRRALPLLLGSPEYQMA